MGMEKILVVEDSPKSREVLEDLLTAENYYPVVAENGREALEKLQQEECQLIISDILMPKMDGFQLCRKCKQDEKLRKIPFIFFTATYTDRKDEELALKLGADCFLRKPQDLPQLSENLKHFLAEPDLKGSTSGQAKDSEILEIYQDRLQQKLEKKVQRLESEINKRQQIETSLRESEARYRNLVENAPSGIVTIELDGTISSINHRFTEITGIQAAEIIGKCIRDIPGLKKELLAEYEQIFSEILNDKTLSEFQIPIKKGTHERLLSANANMIKYDGNRIGVQLIINDITQYIQAVEEKKKLQKQLFQSQKMEALGNLTGGIAHDFNNILTVMQGYTEMALEKIKESDPLQRILTNVVKAAQRAAKLTRQLLLYSRQQPMEFHVFKLNDNIADLLSMLKRLIGDNITLETELGTAIWPIKGDENNIDQIVINMVLNARDAIAKDGKIKIRISNVIIDHQYTQKYPYARVGKYVCLSVEDNGKGIRASELNRIFDPFYTTKEKSMGTGLGLSVVFGIIKGHKGWINVESQPGQGTVFKLYFPAYDVDDCQAVERQKSHHLSRELKGNAECVLIVEDDENVLGFIKEMLTGTGYQVFTASDPRQAIQLFQQEQHAIDLVISDVIMPMMTGLELAREIRKIRPQVKIILGSGYTEKRVDPAEIKKRGYQFVHKPYSMTTLLKTIKQTIR